MKKFLMFMVLVLILLPSFCIAAIHYVRPSGGGGGGTSWTDAYNGLPSSLVRGDTYYIATGSYGAHTFSDSGTAIIYIKKATPTDHGTETGWQASYGVGEAVFTSSGRIWDFGAGYYDFDGGYGSGKSPGGYGFRLYSTASRASNADIIATGGRSYITVRHTEFDMNNGSGTSTEACTRLWGSWATSSNITISYCYFHHSSGYVFYWGEYTNHPPQTNMIVEHSYFYMNGGGGGVNSHWELMWLTYGNNVDIRYNTFDNTFGSTDGQTGWLMVGASTNVKYYGNTFLCSSSSCGIGNNGVIAAWSNDMYQNSNIQIYNNTFVNLDTATGGGPKINFTHNSVSDSVTVRNNLYYNTSTEYYGVTTVSNEACNGTACSGTTNAQTGITSAIFANYAGGNYRLASATSAGYTLASPFNTDPDGSTRGVDGVWDRGAYEYGGVSSIHYIKANGTGDGSTWTNAMAFPSTLVRGHTYVVAGGAYGSKTFSTAVNGTSVITIRKASAALDGAIAGWSSAFATDQATFSGKIEFTSSYWVFDGLTGGGPGSWDSGYGFKITETSDQNAVIRISYTGSASNITIRHVDMQGKGSVSSQGGSYSNDGIAIYNAATNITLSYAWLHGIGRCPIFMMSSGNDVLYEYLYVSSFYGSTETHSEVMSSGQGYIGNTTFRHSLVTDIQSTGGLMWDNSKNTNASFYIYGNVFYKPAGATWGEANGVIGGWTGNSGEQFRNVKVYNNTFINVDQQSLSTFPNTYSGNVAYNNLWYNSQSPQFDKFGTHDYNHFINSGGTHSETNGTSAASGDPFVNYSSLNFALSAATSAGYSLTSPFNADPYGITRGLDGVWDRGAYEYSGITYYVRTDGNDNCSGSADVGGSSGACAFRTIAKAASIVNAGAVVYIRTGAYDESVNISRSGTSGARITFYGATGSSTRRVTISGSYITIDGLNFLNNSGTNTVSFSGSYNIVKNANITNSAVVNVETILFYGSYNKLTLCTIHDIDSTDVIRVWGTNHEISFNEVYNMTCSNTANFHCDFLQTFGSNETSKDILVNGNYLHDNLHQPFMLAQVTSAGDSKSANITRYTITNNIMKNLEGCAWIKASYTRMYNNVFDNSGYAQGCASYFANDAEGDGLTGSELFNNVYLNSARGSSPTNGTNWSGSSDPGFVSRSGGNYHLSSSATALIGMGTTKSTYFTTDKDGLPWIVPWDIGAYRYGEDLTPPVISNPTPSGEQTCSSDPRNVTIGVATNEDSNCRYATTDIAYASMTAFTTTGARSHSSVVSKACGSSSTYYVRCQDKSPALNTNLTSTTISFSIAASSPDDTDAPVMVIGSTLPTGSLACTTNPRNVTLGVTATDESLPITCKYGSPGLDYDSLTGTFDTVLGDAHTKVISLACGDSYSYSYMCADSLGNKNITGLLATFNIESSQPVTGGLYEAEAGSLVSPIAFIADANAHGGYYIYTSTENSGTATFTVTITETATYRIVGRVYAPDTGRNSYFITIDTGTEFIWDINPEELPASWGVWMYDFVTNRGTGTVTAPQYDPYTISLSAGEHTVVFRGREVETRLDYFYFEKADVPPQPPLSPVGLMILGAGGTMNFGEGTNTTMYIQ